MKDFNSIEATNRTSIYRKVKWDIQGHGAGTLKQIQKVIKAQKKPNPLFASYDGKIVATGLNIGMEPDLKPSNSFSFNNKSLGNLSTDGSHTFADDYWDCVIKYDQGTSGKLYIENVGVKTSMHGSTHKLPVFQSIQFKDVIITFDIEGTFIEKSLDGDSNISPGLVTERYGYESEGKYQAGVSQTNLFMFYCANTLITVEVEYSFTFMYPKNDFEPTGVIDASKIFPQVYFKYIKEIKMDMTPYQNHPNAYLINVPEGKNGNKIKVKNLYARTKIVCNNNSSHHLNNLDNNGYDGDYFGSLRDGNHIPLMFEKKYDINKKYNNTVGFYTDSNTGTIKSSGNSDKRARPTFQITLDSIVPDIIEKRFQPAPFWNNIFDYGTYNLVNSTEFNAVNNINQIRQTTKYFPSDLEPQPLTVIKEPRQGAFDNIHLHGYFGFYLDNDQPVIHAPICGYCCFHMHWRWSGLNDEIINSSSIGGASQGFMEGFERLFNVEPKYRGWGKPSKSSSQELPFTRVGAPLIPSDQTLHIAVTPTTFTPEDRTGAVITPETIVPLEQTEKTIWYSVKIENEFGEVGMHLSMEQGCGYAFRYSKVGETMKSTLDSSFPSRYRTILTDPQYEIPGVYDQTFLDYVYDFNTQDTGLSDTEFFEMQYRFMRFFNQAPNGVNRTYVNQVPIINMGAVGTDPNNDNNYGSILDDLMNL